MGVIPEWARRPPAPPRLETRNSPNQSARRFPEAVDLVLVHTPEGSYRGTIDYCLRDTSDVSYNRLISEDGRYACQLVPFHRKAWHGKAYNERAIGLALAGFASSTRALSPGGRQLAAETARLLKARGLPARWARGGAGPGFCRHADVQADRRDPMPLGRWLTFVALVKLYRRLV